MTSQFFSASAMENQYEKFCHLFDVMWKVSFGHEMQAPLKDEQRNVIQTRTKLKPDPKLSIDL